MDHFEVIPLSEVPRNGEPQPTDDRRTVLIVDDEEVIADTLAIILAKSGYATFSAYNGISALELAEAIEPELVITDVMMPGMTGIELAITLRQNAPDCKVLLFSGHAAARDLLQEPSVAANNFEILSKPIHPSDLLRHIRECLDGQSLRCAV
ncbi:hypothetical protein GCM10011507_30260 [Edaphobacter acidisoli]|uniref:Response regulatory domain-containing protein n=1 Tax=Edaphobacter acidisoli TaxID=2040573 RepID=A0A916W8J4_9BACT|nr:response regulator [Edaphobacter acidisoli]GGA76882.1 hypothetical protein GCM10011507_30260 [Edaphobacter acidisoli]